MNIDERLASRNFLVDSNKYDNGGTIGRYIFNAGFVNSSLDNMVINSTGKKNGLPFLTALKNGGHYQNNAFFGGNFVLGEGLFDKVPGISMKNDSPTRFLSNKSIFGYKAQYYNAKSTETMFTDDMIKGIGGNKDFIIQSGVGFSKDYTKFFGALNRQGFNVTTTKEATENLPLNKDTTRYRELAKERGSVEKSIHEGFTTNKKTTKVSDVEANYKRMDAIDNEMGNLPMGRAKKYQDLIDEKADVENAIHEGFTTNKKTTKVSDVEANYKRIDAIDGEMDDVLKAMESDVGSGYNHTLKDYYKYGPELDNETTMKYKELLDEKQSLNKSIKEGFTTNKGTTKVSDVEANYKRLETIDGEIDEVLRGNTKKIDFVGNPETVNIIKDDLKNHINNANAKDTIDLSEHMSFGKKSEQVRTTFGTTKYQNLKSVAKGEAGTEILTSKNKIDMYDDFFKNLDYTEQNLYNYKANATTAEKLKVASKWVDDFKAGKIGETSEIGKFVKNSISKRGEKVLKNGQDFIKNLKGGMVDDINKEFFQLSSLNKIFSNKYVQLATGNYVSGGIAIPLAVTTGIISAGAVQHQEQSINNFRDMFSYDNTPVLDYHSEEALRTGYQHQQLSASNDQDIHYIKGNRNIASRYANDIAPVEIDRTATSLSSFTTI